MPASKYIRMLGGRDAGRTVDAELELANYLISEGRAEAINFDDPAAAELKHVPIAAVSEIRTGKDSDSADGPEILIPQSDTTIAAATRALPVKNRRSR